MPGAFVGLRRDMAQSLKTFTRQAIARQMQSPDAHARVKRQLDRRIEEMTAAGHPPLFQMFVDGRETGDLTSVTFKGSVITLKFPLQHGGALAMLTYAKEISPVRTGRYADAWFLVVNGQPWTDLTQIIPPGSTVYLTNFAPFARRLEEEGRFGRSGRLTSYVRPDLVVTERTRQWARSRFPGLSIERTYIALPGGGYARGWQVPYRLKRAPHEGEQLLYPALEITER